MQMDVPTGKTRAKSAVWDYYSQSGGVGKAVCNACKVSVSTGATVAKTANTSNLWSHLRSHHKEIYEAAKKEQREMESQKAPSHQPTVADPFQRQKQWANSHEKSKQIDKLIAEMIITDNQPFSVVSDVGFQRLVAALNPRYALKSEKFYRTEKIPAIHAKVVQKIKTLIQPENAGFPLAFTTDCWSGTTESLMSLTCHFITNEWERKQVVLNTTVMEGSHTGQYIKDKFLKMIEEWHIDKERIALVLRDSGANMMKGMRCQTSAALLTSCSLL